VEDAGSGGRGGALEVGRQRAAAARAAIVGGRPCRA
jgi:hypothetical protein